MRFCSNCQKVIPDDIVNCPYCGASYVDLISNSILWKTVVGDNPAVPMVALGDSLFIATKEPGIVSQYSKLYILYLADGTIKIEKPFENAVISGLAATENNMVLLSTASTDLLYGYGELIGLNSTGDVLWHLKDLGQHISAPGISAGRVYVTVDATYLVCLDSNTGAELFRISLNVPSSLCAPVVSNDVIIVPCRKSSLLAFDPDGTQKWCFNVSTIRDMAWFDKSPIAIGNYVFATLSNGIVFGLSLGDGQLLWSKRVGPNDKRLTAPITDGKQIYIGAQDGLYALNWTDGTTVWHFATSSKVVVPPVLRIESINDESVIYLVTNDKYIYAINSISGGSIWQYQTTERINVPPVYITYGGHNPLIIIATQKGELLSIALSTGLNGDSEGVTAIQTNGVLKDTQMLPKTDNSKSEVLQTQPDQRAKRLEANGNWLEAAQLWGKLKQPHRRTRALMKYALSLDNEISVTDEQRAGIWSQIAECFKQLGNQDYAQFSYDQAARYSRAPIISLDIEHNGLVINTWTRVQFIVENRGFGTAHNLVIRAQGEQFAGQIMVTQRLVTLLPGQKHTEWLDLKPLEYGDSVPLRIEVLYFTEKDSQELLSDSIHLNVTCSPVKQRHNRITLFEERLQTSEVLIHQTQKYETFQEGLIRFISTHDLRRKLAILDDVELTSICIDYFGSVHDKFSTGMRRDVKINLLLDYCRHRPSAAKQLNDLLSDYCKKYD